LDGEGDASELDAFFFVVEVELVPPFDFFVEVVDFLVVAAVLVCVVVAAVSCLCAQETTKAAAARTVMKPKTNFFIVKVFGLETLRLFNSLRNRKQLNTAPSGIETAAATDG
jgi:hypothetical protein